MMKNQLSKNYPGLPKFNIQDRWIGPSTNILAMIYMNDPIKSLESCIKELCIKYDAVFLGIPTFFPNSFQIEITYNSIIPEDVNKYREFLSKLELFSE